MLKSCFILICLLGSISSLFSQSGIDHNSMMVIEKRGVALRKGPSINNEIVTTLPFGAMIIENFESKQNSVPDTINEIHGDWIHIKYNNQTGYIFNAYLDSHSQTYNYQFPKGWPQFLDQDWNCGDFLFFNPKLNWYGLYGNGNNNAELRKIDIQLKKIESREDSDGLDHAISIITSQPKKSMFLIGLPYLAENKIIRYKPLPIKHTPYGQASANNIYPGEKYVLGYHKQTQTSYTLECHGAVSDGGLEPEGNMNFDKYVVKVIASSPNGKVFQKLEIKPIDEILFIGDLNNDQIDDLIIRDRMYPNASETITYLLMSGYGENVLTKVAENYWGGCY